MKKIIIIGLLAIGAVAVGVYVLTRESSEQNNTSGSTSEGAATGNVITYTDAGFSPATVTVAAGSSVTVVNESSEDLDFSSNQHPVHTDNPELNQDTLVPGDSRSFVVDEEGTWGYHNHLNPIGRGQS